MYYLLVFHLRINNLANEISDVSACMKYNIKQDDTLTSVKVKLTVSVSENVLFIHYDGFMRC